MAPDDLAAVVPPVRVVAIAGVQYPLRPVTLGQLPALLAALKPLRDQIGLDDLAPERIAQSSARVLSALVDSPAVLVDALVAASGLERSVVEGASMAEGVDVLTALIGLNADFFGTAVAPRLAGLFTALGDVAPATDAPGPMPSSA